MLKKLPSILGKIRSPYLNHYINQNHLFQFFFFDSDKTILFKLQNRGLVEIQNEQLSLTTLGRNLAEYWQNRKFNELNPPKLSGIKEARKQQKLEKKQSTFRTL